MIKITATTKDAYNLFHEGALALAQASRNGMRIDVPYCKKKIRRLEKKIEKSKEKLQQTKVGKTWTKIYGRKRNFNSDHQLRKILFNKLGYESTKETTRGELEAVDNSTLEALGDEGINHLLTMKKHKKANDYLKGMVREQVNGIMRPNFPLNLAKTFRSSSNLINFQNMPKRNKTVKRIVRSAIYPRQDHQLCAVDFSGVEVRIAACYHRDPVMLDYINNPKSDMHGDMAEQIFCLKKMDKSYPGHDHLRNGAKNGFVFPQFYGDYYKHCVPNLLGWAKDGSRKDGTPMLEHLAEKKLIKLGKNGNVKSSKKFERHIQDIEDDFWGRRFKVYDKWKKKHYRRYQKKGYVDMFTGFRCSGPMSRNEVINYVIQGAAFHCLLWSFNRVHEMLTDSFYDSMLIGQIHDEMVLDVEPSERDDLLGQIKKITCEDLPNEWDWIIVPIDVDTEASPINESWAKMEGIEI